MTYRTVLSHLTALYLGAGLFAATIHQVAVPAANSFAYLWILGMWPKMVYCAPVDRGCNPLWPDRLSGYMHSFPEDKP